MKRFITCMLGLIVSFYIPLAPAQAPVAIVIHGGAGTLSADKTSAEQARVLESTLSAATRAGHKILADGGSSLDAVIMAVSLLESSPHFNAGIGAVFTWDGQHELDASIMRGDTLAAGAVAGVTTVRSPIKLARAVMEQSPHVLLAGSGAEAFARSIGIPAVDNSIFSTERRRAALNRRKQDLSQTAVPAEFKWGTVGAVALDQAGNLAAATSTGGMTGKRWGRIGDSPLIGAGTYADNRSCAVSATGHGEFFIRYNVAADICARVRYQGADLHTAAAAVIHEELLPAGGTGGVIALDTAGNIAMPFNTPGMYRAYIDRDGVHRVGFYQALLPSRAETDSPTQQD